MVAIRRPRASEEMLAQNLNDGSCVLLDPTDGSYFVLEGVGGRVWELCDGERDFDAIVDAVCADYDAPAEQVAADVRSFLSELADAGLISEASRA